MVSICFPQRVTNGLPEILNPQKKSMSGTVRHPKAWDDLSFLQSEPCQVPFGHGALRPLRAGLQLLWCDPAGNPGPGCHRWCSALEAPGGVGDSGCSDWWWNFHQNRQWIGGLWAPCLHGNMWDTSRLRKMVEYGWIWGTLAIKPRIDMDSGPSNMGGLTVKYGEYTMKHRGD